jgi:predicted metallopeptidase
MRMFNYTEALEGLIRQVVERVGELGHVDPERVLVACARSRDRGPIGAYGKIVPLRFAHGARERKVGRHVYEMPALTYRGREILYLVYVFMPRFGDLPYREGLETVVHELYHVSPRFDGDIRRFPGRSYAHGSSLKRFNAAVAALTERYLAAGEPTAASFLQSTTAELKQAYGPLVGRRVPLPRPVRKG